MAGRREIFVLALYFLTLWSYSKGQDCAWDKDADFPTIPPLLLDSTAQMIYPVLEGSLRMVRVPAGSSLTVACSGSTISALGLEAADGTCAGGDLISIDGTDYALSALDCASVASEMLLKNLGSCGDGAIGILHSITFNVATSSSYPDFTNICFDHAVETTLFTQHFVHGQNILAKDVDSDRPSFKADTGFFTVDVNTIYTQASQLALMEKLLGDADLAAQIIDPNTELYLSRGHINADADNVLVPEQDATYYFINVYPQWQAFNNGNWKNLEYATRDLAVSHGTDITIYSGGWGVLEIDDINSNPVRIFLGLSEDKEVVPVPAVMWRVVYEESTNRAAAVIGTNNPHLTVAPSPLCSDICSSLTWIDFDITDLYKGFTYCCTYDDLRAVIPHIPDLGSVGLLDS